MPIPKSGGKVSRRHGTGITRVEGPAMPIKKMTKTIEHVAPPKPRKKKRKGKVKV